MSQEEDLRGSQRRGRTQLRTSGVLGICVKKEFQHESNKSINRGLCRKVDTHLKENMGYLQSKKP